MATIAQVRDTLVALATAAVYPNGTSAASVTGAQVTLGAGWPLPADIDAAMAAGYSIVSVWPVPGATATVPQLFEPPTSTFGPIGMSAAVNSPYTITLTGTPNVGEYALASIDSRYAYSVLAAQGATNASMAAALASQIATQYPGTTASNGVITVPGAHVLECGLGAPGTMTTMVWRQKQMFRVVIRSPNDPDRNTLEGAIDPIFKSTMRLLISDGSQGQMVFNNVIENDLSERVGEYQRQLVYSVTYPTNLAVAGYPIISVGTEITLQQNGWNAPANVFSQQT